MFTEQAMNARDTDIEEAVDCVAHDFGGDARFFGDGQVRRSCGRDQNRAAAWLHISLSVRDGTRDRLICSTGDEILYGGESICVRASHEQSMPAGDNFCTDAGNLFGRLA